MKSTIGWTAHAATLAAVLLAVWVPFGSRGQWIATAVVLLILGVMLLGSAGKTTSARSGEEMSFSGPGATEKHNRPTYGKKAEDDR